MKCPSDSFSRSVTPYFSTFLFTLSFLFLISDPWCKWRPRANSLSVVPKTKITEKHSVWKSFNGAILFYRNVWNKPEIFLIGCNCYIRSYIHSFLVCRQTCQNNNNKRLFCWQFYNKNIPFGTTELSVSVNWARSRVLFYYGCLSFLFCDQKLPYMRAESKTVAGIFWKRGTKYQVKRNNKLTLNTGFLVWL